jgi:6-phosphogluconolactonase
MEPCHVAIDPTYRFVLVTNYGSGSVAIFALEEDGSLGQMTDKVQHLGSSLHPVRQSAPHPHMVAFDPVTGDLLVPDLGLDAVLIYEVTEDGKLLERTSARIATAPGAGPRHLAFHPNGRHLLLLNEVDNTLIALKREGDRFVPTDAASTLPASFSGHSQAAEVRVSASGRHVFASNRGPNSDSVAMFGFNEASGRLGLRHLQPSAGREPRDFLQSPDERYLFIANQDGNTLVSFEIDEDKPGLRQVSVMEVPSPACLLFA